MEGGLDAAAFRAKPVVDAVAYVVKGLAAGYDRDWVVSSDECSTSKCGAPSSLLY